MDYAAPMSRLECLGYLPADAGNFIDRQSSPTQSLREILDSPRACALRGPDGEGCNQCYSPNRFDPSSLWELHPDVLWDFANGPSQLWPRLRERALTRLTPTR